MKTFIDWLLLSSNSAVVLAELFAKGIRTTGDLRQLPLNECLEMKIDDRDRYVILFALAQVFCGPTHVQLCGTILVLSLPLFL